MREPRHSTAFCLHKQQQALDTFKSCLAVFLLGYLCTRLINISIFQRLIFIGHLDCFGSRTKRGLMGGQRLALGCCLVLAICSCVWVSMAAALMPIKNDPLLSAYAPKQAPWVHLEAGSNQIQPIYIGATPWEMVNGTLPSLLKRAEPPFQQCNQESVPRCLKFG